MHRELTNSERKKSKMDIVVDIQCCKSQGDQIIPKEVAIVSLCGDYAAHWIVAPPCPIAKLDVTIRSQNNYLCRFHHGINWLDGDISIKRLTKNIQDLCRNASKIYLRGKEKASLLQKIVTNEIVNLEDNEQCPPFKNLPWQDKYCLQHSMKFSYLTYSCALNNALSLKDWIITSRKSIDTVDESKDNNSKNEQFRDIEASLGDIASYDWSLPFGPDTHDLV